MKQNKFCYSSLDYNDMIDSFEEIKAQKYLYCHQRVNALSKKIKALKERTLETFVIDEQSCKETFITWVKTNPEIQKKIFLLSNISNLKNSFEMSDVDMSLSINETNHDCILKTEISNNEMDLVNSIPGIPNIIVQNGPKIKNENIQVPSNDAVNYKALDESAHLGADTPRLKVLAASSTQNANVHNSKIVPQILLPIADVIPNDEQIFPNKNRISCNDTLALMDYSNFSSGVQKSGKHLPPVHPLSSTMRQSVFENKIKTFQSGNTNEESELDTLPAPNNHIFAKPFPVPINPQPIHCGPNVIKNTILFFPHIQEDDENLDDMEESDDDNSVAPSMLIDKKVQDINVFVYHNSQCPQTDFSGFVPEKSSYLGKLRDSLLIYKPKKPESAFTQKKSESISAAVTSTEPSDDYINLPLNPLKTTKGIGDVRPRALGERKPLQAKNVAPSDLELTTIPSYLLEPKANDQLRNLTADFNKTVRCENDTQMLCQGMSCHKLPDNDTTTTLIDFDFVPLERETKSEAVEEQLICFDDEPAPTPNHMATMPFFPLEPLIPQCIRPPAVEPEIQRKVLQQIQPPNNMPKREPLKVPNPRYTMDITDMSFHPQMNSTTLPGKK